LAVDGWRLDLDSSRRRRAARVPSSSTRRPTRRWTATRDELRDLLAFARGRVRWIIADEVYHRFYYDGPRSPSFYDVAEPEDRVLYVNTFSKNWAMTGWRIGWVSAPPELGQVIENLIQYSTSGVAAFMQRAATVALDRGDEFIATQLERARRSREIVCNGLASTGRVRFSEPPGAFYVFFSVDGEPDTEKLGLRLVDEANLGIAPATPSAAGRGFLRPVFPAQPGRSRRRRGGWWELAPAPVVDRGRSGRESCRFGDDSPARAEYPPSAIGGTLATLAGVPASWLTGGMIAVGIASLAGLNTRLPLRLFEGVMLMIGITLGNGITPRFLSEIGTWPLSLAGLAVSVVLCQVAVQIFLRRVAGWDRASAFFAGIPGALSYVLILASESRADLGKVAIAQSIRLFLLVALLPSLVLAIEPAPGGRSGRADRAPAGILLLLSGAVWPPSASCGTRRDVRGACRERVLRHGMGRGRPAWPSGGRHGSRTFIGSRSPVSPLPRCSARARLTRCLRGGAYGCGPPASLSPSSPANRSRRYSSPSRLRVSMPDQNWRWRADGHRLCRGPPARASPDRAGRPVARDFLSQDPDMV
jgi:membrane AbrB-like protein